MVIRSQKKERSGTSLRCQNKLHELCLWQLANKMPVLWIERKKRNTPTRSVHGRFLPLCLETGLLFMHLFPSSLTPHIIKVLQRFFLTHRGENGAKGDKHKFFEICQTFYLEINLNLAFLSCSYFFQFTFLHSLLSRLAKRLCLKARKLWSSLSSLSKSSFSIVK